MKKDRNHLYSYDYKRCKWDGEGRTFSVGVFMWIQRVGPGGPKAGPAIVRVCGRTGNANVVYAKCEEICDLLDRGAYAGPKFVTVKS